MIMNQKLSWQAFGKALLDTGDLDPIYVMLTSSSMDKAQLHRWLLAYWMFYHAGVSSRLSELGGYTFWEGCLQGYNGKWPRGTERRHFRGQKALDAIEWLAHKYGSTPEAAVPDVHGLPYRHKADFAAVRDRAMSWPQFGPWIAFKMADMLDRCAQLPVDFTSCAFGVYRDPVLGAALLLHGSKAHPITPKELDMVLQMICEHFADYTAPPYHDRAVNVQEAETILCKWKSHMGGHYPVGKDTCEIIHGLDNWGETAQNLKHNLIVTLKECYNVANPGR
jgi:Alpha-glutamyl/putrescinyl thymine pyrophosphorylase clade 2